MDKLLEKTSACNGTSPAKGGPVKSFQKLLLWCSQQLLVASQQFFTGTMETMRGFVFAGGGGGDFD